MDKCQICQEEYDEKLFNKHLRYEHNIKLADYYTTYFSRNDLFSGQPIIFKNKEQYLTTFYNSRENLKKHLQTLPLHEASKICQDILAAYKENKGYKFAPSETETRSKLIPSPALVHSIGLDYNLLCTKVGLLQRFHYNKVDFYEDKEVKYIVDTREKKVLSLPVLKVAKLDYGDIAPEKNPFRVFIERKSGSDLSSTIVHALPRFKREIERAAKKNDYLIVLCEESISNMLEVEKQYFNRFSFVKGQILFHGIRELLQNYDNIQFAFCNGRPHMIKIIEKIYRCKTDPKFVDWQFLIDKKVI